MNTNLLCGAIYTGFLIPICWYDCTGFRIPDLLSGGCFAAVLMLQLAGASSPGLPVLIASAAAPVLLLLLLRSFSRGSLGLGDVKLSASTGLLLPGIAWLPALSLSALTGLAVAVPLYAAGKINRNTRIPFAPFLGAGTIIIWTVLQYRPRLWIRWF